MVDTKDTHEIVPHPSEGPTDCGSALPRPDDVRESIVLVFIVILVVSTWIVSKMWWFSHGLDPRHWPEGFSGIMYYKLQVFLRGGVLIALTIILSQCIGIDILGRAAEAEARSASTLGKADEA